MKTDKHRDFQERLMSWYAQSHRPLPWKGEQDPYLIWLSEIILQQTRVQQGMPYFESFKEKYPKVEDLAAGSRILHRKGAREDTRMCYYFR